MTKWHIIMELTIVKETKDSVRVIEDSWITTLDKNSLPKIAGAGVTKRIYGTSKSELKKCI